MTNTPSSQNQLISRKEIEEKLNISRATIYRWMESGIFPKSVQLGPNMVRWKISDINDWISDREAKSLGHKQQKHLEN